MTNVVATADRGSTCMHVDMLQPATLDSNSVRGANDLSLRLNLRLSAHVGEKPAFVHIEPEARRRSSVAVKQQAQQSFVMS